VHSGDVLRTSPRAEPDERFVVAVVDGRRRDDLGLLLPGAHGSALDALWSCAKHVS